MRISANLGFLWQELSLPEAIRAAKTANFDAVECHWPYNTPEKEVRQALDETGFTMLGLNTVRGDVGAGENGLAALPGREADAKAAIDQAINYAIAVGSPNVHVMAGFASGRQAHQTFIRNLQYAAAKAAENSITILIEPLNHYDAPDYFLQTSTQARTIIEEIDVDNLKLMFDCYHLQIMEGDITRRLESLMPIIGHIQIASVPDRAEPDDGELDYYYLLDHLNELDNSLIVGAEYKPRASTEAGLGWLDHICRE